MLHIKDSQGRTKFILRDEDEEPVTIDELVLEDDTNPPEEEEEVDDARNDD